MKPHAARVGSTPCAQQLCGHHVARTRARGAHGSSRAALLRVQAVANLTTDGSSEPAAIAPTTSSTTSSSSCPMGFGSSSVSAVPAHELAGLSGSGWRVLSPATGNGSSSNPQQLPEPQGRWCFNPVVGEYLQLESKGAGAFLLDRFREFGPIFSWQLGNRRVVTLVDYDTVSSLLKLGDSKVMVGWNPEAMYAMLGEGARRSLENPAVRMSTRRHLAPGFSREALRGYMGKLVHICTRQLDAWAAAPSPVDLRSEGKALSFEFSTQLLVAFNNIPADAKADLKAKFDALFQGMLAPPINLPGTRYNKGLQAKAALERDVAAYVRASSGSTDSVLAYSLAAKRTYVEGRELTDKEVAEAGIGLIIAGNDTSGLGLTALLAVLPQFPQVLARLREEQQQLIDEHGPELTVSSVLDAMPYCEAVVKEVLRVTPPSAQVMRRTVVDMEICGKFVKAGTILQLSSFMGQVLTDPRLRHDSLSASDLAGLDEHWGPASAASLAADFRPERWLAEAGPTTAAAAAAAAGPDSSDDLQRPSGLLTFSQGPHACLGLSLFMAEAKVLLALIARGYDLTPEARSGPTFTTTFVTQLKQGQVRVSRLASPMPVTAQDRRHSSSSSSSSSSQRDEAAAVVPAAAAV